jgi:hypothetical protein
MIHVAELFVSHCFQGGLIYKNMENAKPCLNITAVCLCLEVMLSPVDNVREVIMIRGVSLPGGTYATNPKRRGAAINYFGGQKKETDGDPRF